MADTRTRPSPSAPHPYTLRLPDGRTLFVEVPGEYVRIDRSGQVGFSIAGVRFLDQLRALASAPGEHPTPGHIVSLRQALSLTQKALAEKIGVDKLTVSRWERGDMRPGPGAVNALAKLRAAAVKRGVVLDARRRHVTLKKAG